MIPDILHQTWKSKTDIPEQFRLWRSSFAEFNPTMDIRLYDDDDNRALLAETFPTLLPIYDALPREIFRCDFIRPVYLFKYGGYYADMDFQCLAPLASLDKNNRGIILGQMGTDDTFRHAIPNAFMASPPNQGFWIGFLAIIEKAWAANRNYPKIAERPEYVVGPVVLKTAVMQYRRNPENFKAMTLEFIRLKSLPIRPEDLVFGRMAVLPGHVLYPLCWTDRIHRRFMADARNAKKLYSTKEAKELFPTSVAVTYWSGTWQGWHISPPDPAIVSS